MSQSEVVIVGAGLAGLCCALELERNRVPFQLLEAADAVGGRVRTDVVEGFRLDRGFQVLLTAYPEARQTLDYSALDLRSFAPGAMVRYRGAWHRVVDPWRDFWGALHSVRSPIGTFADKLKVARLRRDVMSRSIDQLYERTELTTLQSLEHWGFSPVLIDRFFRPFLGGILLDSRLTASSRMFEFVFKMMAEGDTAIPAAGIGAIPDQLAARLPSGSLRLNTRVQSIDAAPLRLTLAGGDVLTPKAVIVAAEGPEAHRLLNEVPEPASRRVTCLYFAAEKTPMPGPWLYLNGNNQPPVNNATVLSEMSSHYAPPGAALISATVLGKPGTKDIALAGEVRDQMVRWFGPAAHRWRHLKTYTIEHAQPAVTPLEDRSPRLKPGLYLCGDYRSTPSIHHAMRSGRLAAEALLADGVAG